jgi:Fe-S-cluster containining protein
MYYCMSGRFDLKRMKKKALEILEYDGRIASQDSVCAGSSFLFGLELFGVRLDLCVVCKSEKIVLEDLVHPARQLCDIIIRETLEHQRLCGQPVRCSAGCMACCKYAITVSQAEALAINSMISNLPRQARQALLRNMTLAGRKILGTCRSTTGVPSDSSNSLAELSRWYARINLTCPYIENKLCSHYADRPLVCREFMVTSPPAQCVPSIKNERIIVDLPIRMSEVLMEVGARLTGTTPQAMFLPLVPAWFDELSSLQDIRYDARYAAGLLIETVLQHRHKTDPAAECCQGGVLV